MTDQALTKKVYNLRLRDTVCSWHSTVHVNGRFSMDFELMPLVVSNIYFWTNNCVQYLWIRRDLVNNVLYNGQCRAWQSHFGVSLAVVILQRQKVMRCVQFYCIWGYSQKPNNAWNKTLHLALEYVQFRSGVSFAALGCSGGQILVQKFTKFDRVCIT